MTLWDTRIKSGSTASLVSAGDGKRTTCNEMESLGMKREKGRRREEREGRGGGKKGK